MPADIHIIGQPVVNSFYMILGLTCSCGGQIVIVGPPGAGSLCSKCRRAFAITGLPVATKDGGLHFPLAEVNVPAPPVNG